MKSTVCAGALAVLVFAAINFASPVVAHAGPNTDYSRSELGGNSGLAIFRAADFGTTIGLALLIDGIPITTLARGEGYRAIIRPGPHRLTITDSPSPYGKTNWTHKTVDFAPGQNYSFTAIWDTTVINLEDGGYVYHGFYR
jgi:hypothetical protein